MRAINTYMNSALSSALGNSPEIAAKSARASQVKNMWKQLMQPIFLEHTNAVYITREKNERTGEDEKILTVYVDESIFAAELNARRELIRLQFKEHFNEDLAEFRIKISHGGMRKKYPFKEEEYVPFPEDKAESVPLEQWKIDELTRQAECIEDEKLRKSFLRAEIAEMSWNNGINLHKSENKPSGAK